MSWPASPHPGGRQRQRVPVGDPGASPVDGVRGRRARTGQQHRRGVRIRHDLHLRVAVSARCCGPRNLGRRGVGMGRRRISVSASAERPHPGGGGWVAPGVRGDAASTRRLPRSMSGRAGCSVRGRRQACSPMFAGGGSAATCRRPTSVGVWRQRPPCHAAVAGAWTGGLARPRPGGGTTALDGPVLALSLDSHWTVSPTVRMNGAVGYNRDRTEALRWRNTRPLGAGGGFSLSAAAASRSVRAPSTTGRSTKGTRGIGSRLPRTACRAATVRAF